VRQHGLHSDQDLDRQRAAAYVAQRAAAWGIDIAGPVKTDMGRVKARKDDIVHQSSSGIEKSLRGMKGCTVLLGPRGSRSRTSCEWGRSIEAPRIFLNVGGRAGIPPSLG